MLNSDFPLRCSFVSSKNVQQVKFNFTKTIYLKTEEGEKKVLWIVNQGEINLTWSRRGWGCYPEQDCTRAIFRSLKCHLWDCSKGFLVCNVSKYVLLEYKIKLPSVLSFWYFIHFYTKDLYSTCSTNWFFLKYVLVNKVTLSSKRWWWFRIYAKSLQSRRLCNSRR